ncbi:hypothetical protein OHB12_08840 [Nocardia sp. NBC_01730]|nr:hypothetical protein OHB12_08840 [Nocardia sp. NBC_01730]
MRRVGACGGNAAVESFFALPQPDVLDRRHWPTREELRLAIVTWIEPTYHRRRLGRLTLIAYGTRAPLAALNYTRRSTVTGTVPVARQLEWDRRQPGTNLESPIIPYGPTPSLLPDGSNLQRHPTTAQFLTTGPTPRILCTGFDFVATYAIAFGATVRYPILCRIALLRRRKDQQHPKSHHACAG